MTNRTNRAQRKHVESIVKPSRLKAMHYGANTGFGERQLNQEHSQHAPSADKKLTHHQQRRHEAHELHQEVANVEGVYHELSQKPQQRLTAAVFEDVVMH